MRSLRTWLRRGIAVALLAVAAGGVSAQITTAPEPRAPDLETARQADAIERKEPGILLNRPSKDTPAEQLGYAAGLKAAGKFRSATGEYLALVHEWHGSAEAPAAQFEAAALFMQRGKLARAFDEFQYLFNFFPGRFAHEAVLDAQFRIANAILTERHMAFLGLNGFTDPQAALPMFQQIARNAPFWKHAAEVQYRVGWILEETGEDLDAVDAYAVVAQRHPDSPFAAEAAFRRALCLRRVSLSCPRDETQCRAALSAFAAFIRDYPQHKGREQAESVREELSEKLASMYYERAIFYDTIARRPKAAAIAYRDFLQKFPLSAKAPAVTERIAELAAMAQDVGKGAR
jgi:outer membrane protein assembly factor BamD (BamD/ComL family)